MKVVIVEDEVLTAEDLADILLKLPDGIEVIKVLSSIAEAIPYFKESNSVDLIFCDIQLGDVLASRFSVWPGTTDLKHQVYSDSFDFIHLSKEKCRMLPRSLIYKSGSIKT